MSAQAAKRTRQHQEMVDGWNLAFAIGQPVRVRRDDGSVLETVTRSDAQMLGGHTAVIWVDGIAGAYSLERVSAR